MALTALPEPKFLLLPVSMTCLKILFTLSWQKSLVARREQKVFLSLFVPKFLLDENGECGERNAVHCGSIEHKMGIKASATCVMNFDGATGYLIGEAHQGLPYMFHMMNKARIGTGVQGLCHAELGLQKSAGYARDRLQMRALTGPANPEGAADPIIVHPDVRRMLLTQKSFC